MTRRIMHPTDFSAASLAAFVKAVEMAKANRAELTIVHVLSPVMPVPGDGYISPKVYDEIAASTRAWAQKELDRRLAKAGADLLVLGTHGRSGLAKLFIGSVAGRVVAAAPCPVLTVRGK